MKILILPLIAIVFPLIALYCSLKLLTRLRHLTVVHKIILGLVFSLLGCACFAYAINVSIQGYRDAGVQCMTGIIVFLPFSILYLILIPLLLIFVKGEKAKLDARSD